MPHQCLPIISFKHTILCMSHIMQCHEIKRTWNYYSFKYLRKSLSFIGACKLWVSCPKEWIKWKWSNKSLAKLEVKLKGSSMVREGEREYINYKKLENCNKDVRIWQGTNKIIYAACFLLWLPWTTNTIQVP